MDRISDAGWPRQRHGGGAHSVGSRFWLLRRAGRLPGLRARAVRAAHRGRDKCLEDVAAFACVQRAVLRRAAVAPLPRRDALALGGRIGGAVAATTLPGPPDAALGVFGSDQHLYL